MATFQDLPLELIIEMVKFFTTRRPTGELDSRNDLCTLRVVSTLFNDLVTPVLFEVLCLNFDNAKLNVLRSNHERRATGILRYRDILTALATGSASVIRQHTKRVELYLRKLYWVDENRLGVVETRKAIEEHLFSAISSLKNLQTVDWHCHFEYEPEQVTRDIILALSTIPSFESFNKLQFLSEPPASFSLKPLSNMRFFDMSFDVLPSKNIISETALLLSRSPNISGFSFRGGEPFQANLDDFFENNKLDQPLRLKTLELSSVLVTPETIRANLSHFKELEFLGITNNLDDSPANFGAICAILEQNNIFLKGILTDTTDLTSVFNYLSSYSGVETICIMLPSIPSDAQKLVDRLYEQVLPRHQETLKCLELEGQLFTATPAYRCSSG